MKILQQKTNTTLSLIIIVILACTANLFAATGTFHQSNNPWPASEPVIPDNGGWDNRATLSINVSGIPSDARITNVTVKYEIRHTYVGDLCIDLTTYLSSQWHSHELWNREGGSADNILETQSLTAFDGGCLNSYYQPVSNYNPNGTWYLVAWDNAGGDEGSIDSFEIWIDWATPADLSVQSVDATNGTYQPGDSIIVNNSIKNIGGFTANSYTVNFYASTNTTITTSDYKIASYSRSSLAGGATHNYNSTCYFPPNSYDGSPIPDGNYYVGMIVTCSNDNNSGNNSGYDSSTVTVDAPNPPDLDVISIDATNGTYQPGDLIVVNNVVQNIGDQTSNSYTANFYASSNTTISTSDYKIASFSRSALSGGGSHSYNTNCYFPPNSYNGTPIPTGNYYIGMIVTCSNDNNSGNNSGYDSSTVLVKWPEYHLKVTNLDDDAFSYVWFDIDDNHSWNPDMFNRYVSVGGNSSINSTAQATTVGWHTVHIMWYDEDHGSWQHLSQEEYIDIDENQEYAFTLDAETKIIGVPHYEQGDYLNWSNPNESAGICVATCLGDVFGYWDTHKYPDDSSGIIYWNLVSNGPAPLIDGSTTDVNSMIRFLADEYYNAPIWDLSYAHVGNTADDFSNSRGLGAWGNTEDFYTKSQLFDFVVTEIDAGRPVGWGVNSFALAGRHYLPIMGYRLLGEDVYVNINLSSYSDEWMDWFASDDWDADTEEITRITPGGIPTDHYEPDDSYSTSNFLDVDHQFNFRQTHNFFQNGDNDWISFSAESGKEYTIETTNLGAGCDTYIYLYSTNGITEITHDDDGGQGVASKVIWKCLQSGTYYVKIRDYYSDSSGHDTNYDIEVSYVDFFAILPSAGPHGSINPSSIVYKYADEDQQFTAIPNTDYTVDTWYLDGSPVQTGGSTYTLQNIQSGHIVYVAFKYVPPQYTITASAGPNGSINPSGDIVKTEGEDQQFTAIPDSEYTVNEWYLDGSPVQIGGSTYILQNIQSDYTVHVTFKYVIIGDITGDGKVDYEDLARLADEWLWTGQSGGIPEDIVQDGIVNFADFAILANHWLEGTTP